MQKLLRLPGNGAFFAPKRMDLVKVTIGFRGIEREFLEPVREDFLRLKQKDMSWLRYMPDDPNNFKLKVVGPISVPTKHKVMVLNRSDFVHKLHRDKYVMRELRMKYRVEIEQNPEPLLRALLEHFAHYNGVLTDWTMSADDVTASEDEVEFLLRNIQDHPVEHV